MSKGLSRRDMLAGVAGAGAAAMLAGCAPNRRTSRQKLRTKTEAKQLAIDSVPTAATTRPLRCHQSVKWRSVSAQFPFRVSMPVPSSTSPAARLRPHLRGRDTARNRRGASRDDPEVTKASWHSADAAVSSYRSSRVRP